MATRLYRTHYHQPSEQNPPEASVQREPINVIETIGIGSFGGEQLNPNDWSAKVGEPSKAREGMEKNSPSPSIP